MMYWLFAGLEELEEATPYEMAVWYEERALRERLEPEAFARMLACVERRLRQLATRYKKSYLSRRWALKKYVGERDPQRRPVFSLAAPGRRMLDRMRAGEVPGAPADVVVPGLRALSRR